MPHSLHACVTHAQFNEGPQEPTAESRGTDNTPLSFCTLKQNAMSFLDGPSPIFAGVFFYMQDWKQGGLSCGDDASQPRLRKHILLDCFFFSLTVRTLDRLPTA